MSKILSGLLVFYILFSFPGCKPANAEGKVVPQEQQSLNVYTKDEFLKELDSILRESERNKMVHDEANFAPFIAESKTDGNLKNVGDVKEKDIDEAFSYFAKAKDFEKENKPEKAIENYKLAVKLNPSFLEAYGNLGIIYAEKGDYKNSSDSFKKYLSLTDDPEEKKLVKQFIEKMSQLSGK